LPESLRSGVKFTFSELLKPCSGENRFLFKEWISVEILPASSMNVTKRQQHFFSSLSGFAPRVRSRFQVTKFTYQCSQTFVENAEEPTSRWQNGGARPANVIVAEVKGIDQGSGRPSHSVCLRIGGEILLRGISAPA
jgi:hypothetical protein